MGEREEMLIIIVMVIEGNSIVLHWTGLGDEDGDDWVTVTYICAYRREEENTK